jgi:hypothetical protein
MWSGVAVLVGTGTRPRDELDAGAEAEPSGPAEEAGEVDGAPRVSSHAPARRAAPIAT